MPWLFIHLTQIMYIHKTQSWCIRLPRGQLFPPSKTNRFVLMFSYHIIKISIQTILLIFTNELTSCLETDCVLPIKLWWNSIVNDILSNYFIFTTAAVNSPLRRYPIHNMKWDVTDEQRPQTTWCPFNLHGWTLIPAYISNHMASKVRNEISYPFLIFNGATVEVWEWICNFISHFIRHVIIYPCWAKVNPY